MKREDAPDITGKIGELFQIPNPEWLMYSYSRPGSQLWQGIAESLWKNGWGEELIREWLQSKHPRWELDGELGDMIRQIGRLFGERYAREHREECERWVKERGERE